MAFFSLPGHRRYNYKPWFYNEKDEKRKERQKKIERQHRLESVESMDDAPNFIHFARKEREKSNKRIAVIFLFLIAIYYFLKQRYLS